MSGTPANWYPDPSSPSQERWWHGTAWTEHVRPKGFAPPTPPPPDKSTSPPPPSVTPLSVSPSAEDQGVALAQDSATRVDSRQVDNVVEDGLGEERERWLEFATAEFADMVVAYDSERAKLEEQLATVERQLIDTSEHLSMQEIGVLFDGDHPTVTSVEFKAGVDTARSRRKEMGKRKDAVLGSTSWQVNGSLSEGRKMVDQFSKLMLRAYNSELDSLVKQTSATNVETKVKALGKKRDQIKKLGQSMNIEIAFEYHDLAVYELRQTGLFQAAKLREKEVDRAHREQLREQKKVEQEIQREQDKLDKEARLHVQALAALEANPDASQAELELLRTKISEVEAAQADVFKRAANTRAGHVYVISNPGSFGVGVVKIGMTRRLEPLDRVNELGDASVPFRFSVHALIFSDDAVSLETELHRRFEPVRINKINRRREFFRTTPHEVRAALVDMNAHLVEFDEEPTNEEWEASQ